MAAAGTSIQEGITDLLKHCNIRSLVCNWECSVSAAEMKQKMLAFQCPLT